MEENLYANDDYILTTRKTGSRDQPIKEVGPCSPHPVAAASHSRVIQVLLAALCLILLCALGILISLYVSKSKQLESLLKTQNKSLLVTASTNMTAISHPTQRTLTSNNLTCGRCKVCAEGWVFHGGKCYFFSNEKMIWNKSRDQCVSKGGHLVIINSDEEQIFLFSRTKQQIYWIGMTDLETEGEWLWVDNTPLNQTGVIYWYQRHDGTKSEPDNWTT
ncbi:hypothetical protein UPYG_G00334060 [Umbra pygmaea]|uniref:C-type lectin domain-containing protein n=1 Tax=Umbra pygmaea TaxID=75934 RepID=A0ABD0W011_UMBPY